jgi:hypothetical protein
MPTRGFYNGVTLRFVPGNKRGTAFAETLAQALNEQRIAASAIGDAKSDAAVDHRIAQAATQDATLTRDSKEFEPVTVVVGDKP